MQAHEIMINQVYTANENDLVRSVIKKFIKYRISGVPIINDKNQIVAYVSDGDIMRYIGKHENLVVDFLYYVSAAKGDDDEFEDRLQKILNLNIMDIAQRKVIKVNINEDIENVASILAKKSIKKLPVEHNGILVGIISRGDVIRSCFKSIL
ncbi:CBS domain-containing protein [Clostridium scatologenes]|uniref:Putative signal transduction protein with CBS domains n=1 Tax=Clostridium scatologenes TaxID=1548 RepID=A0A0E3M9K4_CLOSL|nr:CBS domain-containing protein [Clostridium scatologenes]AKA69709.1 putative signal transduction protein with CBS domains [Clostridium scatologenes]